MSRLHTNVFEPTTEQRKTVKHLSSMGVPHTQIRTKIINPKTGKPVDVYTLRRYFDDDLDSGKCDANEQVMGVLFAKALEGDTKALGMWVNTQIVPFLARDLEDQDRAKLAQTQRTVPDLVKDLVRGFKNDANKL